MKLYGDSKSNQMSSKKQEKLSGDEKGSSLSHAHQLVIGGGGPRMGPRPGAYGYTGCLKCGDVSHYQYMCPKKKRLNIMLNRVNIVSSRSLHAKRFGLIPGRWGIYFAHTQFYPGAKRKF